MAAKPKEFSLVKKFSTRTKSKRLYEAWISEKMVIAPTNKIECQPEIGGVMKLHTKTDEGTKTMFGQFVDVVPNKKLIYTWRWEGDEEETVVRIEFIEKGIFTEVVVSHTGFLDRKSRDAHDAGWVNYFEGLEALIEKKG